jgi:DNA-binding MarR family transcriptional regulator
MTRLSDTQLVILSAAANRNDGSIFPFPDTLKGGAADKVVQSLIRKGFVERIADDRLAVDDLLRITRAGLEAINFDPAEVAFPLGETEANDVPPVADDADTAKAGAGRTPKARKAAGGKPEGPGAPRTNTKQALMIEMLSRAEGATVEQIAEATGWQNHSVRGAIAGALKKKLGLTITTERVRSVGPNKEGARGSYTVYRVAN